MKYKTTLSESYWVVPLGMAHQKCYQVVPLGMAHQLNIPSRSCLKQRIEGEKPKMMPKVSVKNEG